MNTIPRIRAFFGFLSVLSVWAVFAWVVLRWAEVSVTP